MSGQSRLPWLRGLFQGVGSCAISLSLSLPAQADAVTDALNKAKGTTQGAVQSATSNAPVPLTQAQLDKAKADLEQRLQQALPDYEQHIATLLAEKRQGLEQARLASIASERAKVDQLHRSRPLKLPTTPAVVTGPGNPAGSTPLVNATTATSTSTPSPFQFDSATTDTGTPGVAVGLQGSGFTPQCEVHFVVGAGRDIAVHPDWSDSGAMGATLPPDLSGLQPYAGAVYVKREDGRTSASKPFLFKPRLEVARIDPSLLRAPLVLYYVSSGPSTAFAVLDSNTGNSHWHLDDPTPTGATRVAAGLQLRNGWLLDSVDLKPVQGSYSLSGLQANTPRCTFDLSWTTLPFGCADTFYTLIIYGPAGVPYH